MTHAPRWTRSIPATSEGINHPAAAKALRTQPQQRAQLGHRSVVVYDRKSLLDLCSRDDEVLEREALGRCVLVEPLVRVLRRRPGESVIERLSRWAPDEVLVGSKAMEELAGRALVLRDH